jgi:hypothetical protein
VNKKGSEYSESIKAEKKKVFKKANKSKSNQSFLKYLNSQNSAFKTVKKRSS